MNSDLARRLLILSCSELKANVARASPQQLFGFMTTRRARSLPAWKLYRGVAFRVVKRCQREGAFPADVDIVILSARHGLITPDREITYYDLKMTTDVAARQRGENCRVLRELMGRHGYREIFLMLGRAYLEALGPVSDWGGECKVIHEPADIGVMLGRLKAWLRT